jgi:hypothetical protein
VAFDSMKAANAPTAAASPHQRARPARHSVIIVSGRASTRATMPGAMNTGMPHIASIASYTAWWPSIPCAAPIAESNQSLSSSPGIVETPRKPMNPVIVASQAPRPRTSGAMSIAGTIQNA